MAKVHGRKAFFSITDSGGVVRDLSNAMNNIDYPDSVDIAEVSGFGDTDKSYVIGLKTRTIRAAGNWKGDANDVDEVFSGLLGGGAAGTLLATYIYGPAGSAAGNVKYTGQCIVTAYGRTSPIGGAVTFSADMQGNGTHTRTTF